MLPEELSDNISDIRGVIHLCCGLPPLCFTLRQCNGGCQFLISFELESRYEVADGFLGELLREDILEHGEKDLYYSLGKDLKESWRSFKQSSVTLSQRYISIASLAQATEVSNYRSDMRTEVQQRLQMINVVLSRENLEIISDLGSGSSVHEDPADPVAILSTAGQSVPNANLLSDATSGLAISSHQPIMKLEESFACKIREDHPSKVFKEPENKVQSSTTQSQIYTPSTLFPSSISTKDEKVRSCLSRGSELSKPCVSAVKKPLISTFPDFFTNSDKTEFQTGPEPRWKEREEPLSIEVPD